jgi:cell division protein FtsB
LSIKAFALKKYHQKAVNRIMKVFKYLIGIWIVIVVYAIISFLSGPKGLSAYNQLLAEKEEQQTNLEALGTVNKELEKTKNSLLDDEDTLLAHARQLGYGQEDERYVRIVGLGGINAPQISEGKVYLAPIPDFLSDRTIKIIALCAGFVVFAFFFVLELIRARR